MFGFISTSKDLSTAKKFLGNSLIIINIEDEIRKKELDFGYIDFTKNRISEYD
jgi:hypothetical protein